MPPEKKDGGIIDRLRRVALRQPDTEEGIACAGTPAERRTIKTRNKAFLFLGAADAMLKLRDSIPEAAGFSACRVGAGGWTKLTFGADDPVPLDMLERWVKESYRLLVPKKTLRAAKAKGGKSKEAATPATRKKK